MNTLIDIVREYTVYIALSGFLLFMLQLPILLVMQRRQDILNKTLNDLRSEIHALLHCERNMGDRIKKQQSRLQGIVERQDKIEVNEMAPTTYKQAIALMHKGASANELVETCDISRGELELIARLQGKKPKKSRRQAA